MLCDLELFLEHILKILIKYMMFNDFLEKSYNVILCNIFGIIIQVFSITHNYF